MKKTQLLNPKLLSSIAFLWALTGVSEALAQTSAQEFLDTAQKAAVRTAACQADADDLASEAALRFLKSRRPDSEPPSSRGYIVQSVRNVQREWLRKTNRTRPVGASEEAESLEGSVVGLSTPVSNPSRQAQFQELFEALSPGELEVLALMEEGLGERDIARETGESRYRVRNTIERIRKQAEKLVT